MMGLIWKGVVLFSWYIKSIEKAKQLEEITSCFWILQDLDEEGVGNDMVDPKDHTDVRNSEQAIMGNEVLIRKEKSNSIVHHGKHNSKYEMVWQEINSQNLYEGLTPINNEGIA